MKKVALIPARYGSKRSPLKNIRELAGHPLIAYSIYHAKKSNVFDDVIVSTDSKEIADIALKYGASVPFMRPESMAQDLSTDYEWIEYTLTKLKNDGISYDCFSILRPTNPFRTSETIKRAWTTFETSKNSIDSIRAVQLCKEHPGKMWVLDEGNQMMSPLMNYQDTNPTPFHSRPYQSLPKVYIQNASLEIAWSKVIFENKTISGEKVKAFLTEGYEGIDINTEFDWYQINYLLSEKKVDLPKIF